MDELQKAQDKARLAEARATVFEQELILTRHRLADGQGEAEPSPEVLAQLAAVPNEVVSQRLGEHLDYTLKLVGYNTYLQSRVRELENALAETQRKGQTDPLTGLADPGQLTTQLDRALAANAQGQATVGLVLVELERPLLDRALNSSRTDALIKQAGQRLAGLVRPQDTLGRWADCQFLIVLWEWQGGTQGQASMNALAPALAQRAAAVLAEPFELEGFQMTLSAWAGVVVVSNEEAEVALDMTRRALKQARTSGTCPYHLFGKELQEKARRSAAIQPALAQARTQKQLHVFYQPIISATENCMIGVETRLRWIHPSHGVLEARQFIEVLEDSGLILASDEWVISEACQQVKEHGELSVWVNISLGHLLVADAARRILSLIEASGIRPQRVSVELPEQGLERAPERMGQLARELSRSKVAVAIDGFGTRLSALGGLPVRAVKLDARLVASLAQPESQRLCRAALSLAHQLEIKVVAKGVETAQQAAWLRQAGCDYMQGHFFSQLVPAGKLPELAARSWA